MYRGAVPGSNARINPLTIEDFIILDIVPVDVSSSPNRFRREAFVRYSP